MHTRQGVAVPAQSDRSSATPSQERAIEELRQALAPIWAPLEKLCPPGICEQFMYMGKAGAIHLYKHVDSRRYLNVDAQGVTYAFNPGSSSYEPISVVAAMRELGLDSLEELFSPSERVALAILFQAVRA